MNIISQSYFTNSYNTLYAIEKENDYKIRALNEYKNDPGFYRLAVIDPYSNLFVDCKIIFTDDGYHNFEYQNLYFKWYYDEEGTVYKLSNYEKTAYMRLIHHKPKQIQGIIAAYRVDYETLKTQSYQKVNALEGITYYVIRKRIPIRFIEVSDK